MRNANMIWALSCAVAVATACSSSSTSPNNPTEGGTGDDASTTPGDDGGGPPVMGMPEASITCKGPADCGGAGHSCCYSTMTNATMCRTGTCGMDYTQCSGSNADCPNGGQCIQSPLGADVHYCVPGDGGGASGDSGTSGDGSTTAESGTPDAGTDASSDGPAE
jgi:hypothetical protein